MIYNIGKQSIVTDREKLEESIKIIGILVRVLKEMDRRINTIEKSHLLNNK